MHVRREGRPRAAALAVTGAWLAASAGLVASCLVAGFDVTSAGGTTTGQAGAVPDASSGGGGTGTGTGGTVGCRHATWPPVPTSVDPGPSDVDFVTAMRQVHFGEDETDVGVSVGYDIDNRCTCQGEDSACLIPSWATADPCDGPDGRDNATAFLFDHLGIYTDSLTSETNTQGIVNGEWSLLIRVRSYNGQPNDDQVELSIYTSPGRDNDPCIADQVPLWDGTDRWPIDVESLVGTGGAGGATAEGGCSAVADEIPGFDFDQPRFTDTAAYVSGGTVVANLPQAGLTMSGVDRVVNIKITAGFVTARIEQDGSGSWILRDGLLVGRWRVADFFEMLGSLEYLDAPLCPSNPVFALVKGEVCKFPDVASTLGGPTTPCDSLSFAMGFDADPAILGMMWHTGATGGNCPPGDDPSLETCD